MDKNEFYLEVKTICDKINELDPLDEFTLSDLWDELAVLFSKNEDTTLIYLKECFDPAILSIIGAIIDDIALMLQSSKFVALIKEIVFKNEKYWRSADWIIQRVENAMQDDYLLPVLKKYKTPSAWCKRNALLSEYFDKIELKIASLQGFLQKKLLTSSEQTELKFLQKIQAADDLETLQNIVAEIEQTPTTDEIKMCLLQDVEEKKAFY